MFNKKVLALTVITLSGAIALTGCSSNNSTPSDNSSKGSTTITTADGTQSLETLASVYSNSLAKAEAEGIVEKTTYASGGTSFMLYDSTISKTIAVTYQGNLSEAAPTEVNSLAIKGNLASFAKINYDDKVMQVNNDAQGVFVITAKDTATDKTKVTITTKDGIITGYDMVDFNGNEVLSSTLQYGGLTAEDKAALSKYANTVLPSIDEGSSGTGPILIEE